MLTLNAIKTAPEDKESCRQYSTGHQFLTTVAPNIQVILVSSCLATLQDESGERKCVLLSPLINRVYRSVMLFGCSVLYSFIQLAILCTVLE